MFGIGCVAYRASSVTLIAQRGVLVTVNHDESHGCNVSFCTRQLRISATHNSFSLGHAI